MQPLCFLLAQDPVERLAKKCPWQLVAKFNVPRNFIRSQVSPAVLYEVVLGHVVRGWNDNRLDRLAPVLRHHTDDRSFSYLRMEQQHFLDFGRLDIEA